jgi:hypothetical protein
MSDSCHEGIISKIKESTQGVDVGTQHVVSPDNAKRLGAGCGETDNIDSPLSPATARGTPKAQIIQEIKGQVSG